jgi:hypothetical protein
VRAIVGDRAYRGLAGLAERKHLALDIKAPPPGTSGFTPLWPLYRIEHAFAQLGRWRSLSRCYEGTEASARAWLEVASLGPPLGRLLDRQPRYPVGFRPMPVARPCRRHHHAPHARVRLPRNFGYRPLATGAAGI